MVCGGILLSQCIWFIFGYVIYYFNKKIREGFPHRLPFEIFLFFMRRASWQVSSLFQILIWISKVLRRFLPVSFQWALTFLDGQAEVLDWWLEIFSNNIKLLLYLKFLYWHWEDSLIYKNFQERFALLLYFLIFLLQLWLKNINFT